MKRPITFEEKSKNRNKIQKSQNIHLTEIANNLFSNKGISDIKFNLINCLIEFDCKTLVYLRRTSQSYYKDVACCLTKTLNERYSEDSKNFQILEHAKVLCMIPRCLTYDLQQALVFYFHAQRNREQTACFAFKTLFDSHLESFKSNCQDVSFNCIPMDQNAGCFELDFNELGKFQIDFNIPFSAYLFTHFLNRFVTSKAFNNFISESLNHPLLLPIIDFLKIYKSFNSVARIIEEIMLRLSLVMPTDLSIHNNASDFEKMIYYKKAELKKGALLVFQVILEHDLIDKPLAIKFELIEKIASCLSDMVINERLTILSSLAKCAKLGLIDTPLVIKLNLVKKIASFFSNIDELYYILSCLKNFAKKELIASSFLVWDLIGKIPNSFLSADFRLRDKAWSCMTTFVEQGLIDDLSLQKKRELIEKIFFCLPYPNALSCFEKCANRTLINHSFPFLPVLIKKLASFLSFTPPLFQTEASAERRVENLYHISVESQDDIFFKEKSLSCIGSFVNQGFIDLTSVRNLNLIEKIAFLLPNLKAISCLEKCAEKNLIDKFLVAELQLVEKMLDRQYDYFPGMKKVYRDIEISAIDCLLKFLEKGLIDRSLIKSLNLPEIIIGSAGFMLDKHYSQCSAALICLKKLAENGFIDSSIVMKYNLVEKVSSFLLITECNINDHASSCLEAFDKFCI